MTQRKTGFYWLIGLTENNYGPVFEANNEPSYISINRQTWDLLPFLAENLQPYDWNTERGTLIGYAPLIPGNWDLWRNELSIMVGRGEIDAAVSRWVRAVQKDGDTLDDMIAWVAAFNHRLLVQPFGEIPSDVYTDQFEMEKLAIFEQARAVDLWDRGGMASMFGFSMGTTSQERIDWIQDALWPCRWSIDENGELVPPIAMKGIREYAPLWPTVWMGGNQTDVLGPDATRQDEINAVFQTPYYEDMHPNPAPAYLCLRTQFDPGGDNTPGYHQLDDVVMVVEEGFVDVVIDEHIIWKEDGSGPYSGWYTVQHKWDEWFGLEGGTLHAYYAEVDDIYDAWRIRLPDGSLRRKYPARASFCGGPGNYNPDKDAGDWEDYDWARTSWSARQYAEYLNTPRRELPVAITNAGGGSEPPPPDDGDCGLLRNVLCGFADWLYELAGCSDC